MGSGGFHPPAHDHHTQAAHSCRTLYLDHCGPLIGCARDLARCGIAGQAEQVWVLGTHAAHLNTFHAQLAAKTHSMIG